MATFTSTLSDNLLQQLAEKAAALNVPKNKIIETALRVYLEHLEKAEYIKSYKQASEDKNIIQQTEKDMEEYLSQFEK